MYVYEATKPRSANTIDSVNLEAIHYIDVPFEKIKS